MTIKNIYLFDLYFKLQGMGLKIDTVKFELTDTQKVNYRGSFFINKFIDHNLTFPFQLAH